MNWYSKKLSEVEITDHLRCVVCGGFIDGEHNQHLAKSADRPPLCCPRCVARYDDECATLGVLYLRPIDYAHKHWYGHIWYDQDATIHLELHSVELHGVLTDTPTKKGK